MDKKHVIVAGEDGEIYRLDGETGKLTLLDHNDPIRKHAQKLIDDGVVTADVELPGGPPPDPAIVYDQDISIVKYHLVNMASFEDPDADDD